MATNKETPVGALLSESKQGKRKSDEQEVKNRMVRVFIKLDPDLHRRFKAYVAANGSTMQQTLVDMISRELEK